MAWMEGTDAHDGHGGAAATDAERRTAMGMATDEELAALRAARGQEADCLYLELMIRHHKGALDMVDAIEDLGSVARVKDVAGSMGEVQASEVVAMEEMQEQFGCTP